MKITCFENQSEWVNTSVEVIEKYIQSCVNSQSFARLAVSGGNTPYPIYQALSQRNISWSQVDIIQVDERYVPLSHPESNWSEFQKSFVQLDQVHSKIYFDYSDSIQITRDQVESQLPSQLGITILGMGLDGHFASLFPGGVYWDTHISDKTLITQAPPEYATQNRLSLSPWYIASSEMIIVLLKGQEKYDYLQRNINQESSPKKFPLSYIFDHPQLSIFVMK
jgi:6-phosphogluconolactonase